MSIYRVMVRTRQLGRVHTMGREYSQRPAAFKYAEQIAEQNPEHHVSVWEYKGPTDFQVHPVEAPQ